MAHKERIECTPEQQAVCPIKRRHIYNRHHLYYPAYEYSTKLERAFRELGEHSVMMCTFEHNELHATTDPPPKPSRTEMIEAVYKIEE